MTSRDPYRRPTYDLLLAAGLRDATGRDSSFNNRTPTVGAGVTFPSGVADFGGGSTASITYPDAADLDTSPVTITMWCRIDPGNSGRVNLIGKHVVTASLPAWKGWYIHHSTSSLGYLFASDEDGATKYKVRYYAASAGFNDGVWRHVAWVVPSMNVPSGWAIYVNGALITTADASGAGAVSSLDTAEPLTLGGRTTNNQDKYLNGALSDVRLYNRSLSAAEIGGIYAATSGVNRP